MEALLQALAAVKLEDPSRYKLRWAPSVPSTALVEDAEGVCDHCWRADTSHRTNSTAVRGDRYPGAKAHRR
jgi:hypothetical protein